MTARASGAEPIPARTPSPGRYPERSATGVGWDTTGKRGSGASSAWVLLSVT